MFKPFHDRSLIDKVSDIKPNRVAENGQNKSDEKSNYEIEIKKKKCDSRKLLVCDRTT